MTGTCKSPCLCRGALCVLECTSGEQFTALSQPSLLLAKSLKVDWRWELKASWVHSEHAYSLIHRHDLSDSLEYAGVLQAFYVYVIPWLFPHNFLCSACCLSHCYHSHRQCDIRQLCSVFDRYSWEKGCLHWVTSAARPNKDKPWKWSFPGNCQEGQIITVLWDWDLRGEPSTLHPSYGC